MTIDEGRSGGTRAAWDAPGATSPHPLEALYAARLAFRLGDRRLVDAWLARALALASAEGPEEAAMVHLAAANLDRSAGRFSGCLRHVERAFGAAGDHDQAVMLYHCALSIQERAFGPESARARGASDA
ncbi:hypothetical protein WMF04_11415 [Sorangium sp. So ce260]|uniref:hypothetical protein n=1 Tax=Sorangium sp. So ce260 TaxID=3133291 RepID=UPI003F644292